MWIKNILKILFIEDGKYVDISKIKLTDVVSVNVKKVKNITYGVTDYNDVIKVDICSKCHPFFTGKQKLVDTGGRVDKFKKRYNL